MLPSRKSFSIVFLVLFLFSINGNAKKSAVFEEGFNGLDIQLPSSNTIVIGNLVGGATATFHINDNDSIEFIKISSSENCKNFFNSIQKTNCSDKFIDDLKKINAASSQTWSCAGKGFEGSVSELLKESKFSITEINSFFQRNKIDLRGTEFINCLDAAREAILGNQVQIYCNNKPNDKLRCDSDKKVLFLNNDEASGFSLNHQILELCGTPRPFLYELHKIAKIGVGTTPAALPDSATAAQRDQPINVPKPPQKIACPGCSKVIDEVRVAQQSGAWDSSPEIREKLTTNLRNTFAAPIRAFTTALSPTNASAGSDSGAGSVRRPSSTNPAGLVGGRGGGRGRASSVGKSASKANTKSEVLDPTAIGPSGERINYFDDKQGSVRAEKVTDSSNASGSTTDPKSDVGVSGLSGPSNAEAESTPGVNRGVGNSSAGTTADRPKAPSEASTSNSLYSNDRYSAEQNEIIKEIQAAANSSKTLPSELVAQEKYANKLKENGIRVIFEGKPGSIGAEKKKSKITVVIKAPPAANKAERESVRIID
jgi:hypothetical protein